MPILLPPRHISTLPIAAVGGALSETRTTREAPGAGESNEGVAKY